MYQYVRNELGNNVEGIIRRKSDGMSIPFEPANSHYQEYLEWLAEGNTPEEAE